MSEINNIRIKLRHGILDDSEIDYTVAEMYEPFIYSNEAKTKYALGVFVPNQHFNEQNVSLDDPDWDKTGNCRYAFAKIDLELITFLSS